MAGKIARCTGCGRRVHLRPPQAAVQAGDDAADADEVALLKTLDGAPAIAPPEDVSEAALPDVAPPAGPYAGPPPRNPGLPLVEAATETASPPNFWLALPGALVYPLCRGGLTLLLCGVLFYTGVWLLANMMLRMDFPYLSQLVDVARGIAMIILTGYLAGYLMKIIADSGEGDATPPNWPDLCAAIENAFKPLLYFAAVGVFAFGAPAAYYHFSGRRPDPQVLFCLKAWGCLYVPMGILACSVFRDPRSLNPWYVIKAIVRVPFRYFAASGITFLALWAITLLNGLLLEGFTEKGMLEVMGRLALFLAAAFYCLFVVARLLGVLFHTSSKELHWLVE